MSNEVPGRGGDLARLVEYQFNAMLSVVERFNQSYDTQVKINLEVSPGVGTNPDAMQFTLTDGSGEGIYWLTTVSSEKKETTGKFIFLAHYVQSRITWDYLMKLLSGDKVFKSIIATNEQR